MEGYQCLDLGPQIPSHLIQLPVCRTACAQHNIGVFEGQRKVFPAPFEASAAETSLELLALCGSRKSPDQGELGSEALSVVQALSTVQANRILTMLQES